MRPRLMHLRLCLALVFCLGAFLVEAASRRAWAADYQFATGSYAGDGTASHAIATVGFKPDLVIVSANANRHAVARTSTMSVGRSKALVGDGAANTDRTGSLDASGFTVGGTDDVNKVGTTHYWIDFRVAAGSMAMGTYNGNGQDARKITGLGFLPTYVLILSEGARPAALRFVEETFDNSLELQRIRRTEQPD